MLFQSGGEYFIESFESFCDISREMFFSEEDSGKMWLVVLYLRMHCDFMLSITTCVRWLTIKIGYSPKSGKNNSMDQVRDILYNLRQRGAIFFDDFGGNTDMIDIQLCEDSEYFRPEAPYVRITRLEFDMLTKREYQRKDLLLAVFMAVKGRMSFDSERKSYGYAYASEKTLLGDVNKIISTSHNTVDHVLDVLCDGLLFNRYSVGGYINNKDEFRLFPTFYSLGFIEINEDECVRTAQDILRSRGIFVERFIPVSEAEEEQTTLVEESAEEANKFDTDTSISSAIEHITFEWRR